jgi:hypothetical protein
MDDNYYEKPVLPVTGKEISSTVSPHTYKTSDELIKWWLDGVREMQSKPLAAWKTDNPNHPGYQKDIDPTLEEV